MKTKEVLQNGIHDEIESKSLKNAAAISVSTIINKHMKRAIYLASLVGIGLLFNSCIGGYIATEPAYVEYSRPQQPSSLHIWIDGDWYWSNQSHTYVKRNGYWVQPRPNHTYVVGYWQTSPKGRYWKSGYWQRQGHQGRNRHR
ncbi:MAG: hypothetical protein EHM93_12800 [Bacteroidales bacterium]|nr:MAG: hypothetical protein EHM93_12800 [Bacteroidales bacterium]